MKNAGAGLPSTVAAFPKAYSSPATTACIEAQLAVVVEEIAILRKCEKLGTMEDLPIGLVQEIEGEEHARVA